MFYIIFANITCQACKVHIRKVCVQAVPTPCWILLWKNRKKGLPLKLPQVSHGVFIVHHCCHLFLLHSKLWKGVGQMPPLQLSVVIVKLSILILPKRWIFGTKEPSKNWEDWNQCCVIRRVKTTDWTVEWNDNHISLWLNSSLLLS